MLSRFDELRKEYPVFHYNSYEIQQDSTEIVLKFHFSIDHFCEFRPMVRIPVKNLPLRNSPDSPLARELVFALGLVELISYWKCVCPPTVAIHCNALVESEILWWKRLWFHGLGEFFYQNGIETDQERFLRVQCDGTAEPNVIIFHRENLSLVPVGGGKDSCVALHLLKEQGRALMGFTVNDQIARCETFAAAGFAPSQMLHTHRMIDAALLQRNAEGYWNGHTPFSAIVAFLGLYGAYLVGAGELVLSNEASANEPSVPGTKINHQYSKSYAFERDMNDYIGRRFGLPVRYFSLLRPFHELQIAKQFAALPQYHFAFKSCNVGSKQNVWCCKCAKCLFVYLMLAPFLPTERMFDIFGENLLRSPDLQEDLLALVGGTNQKPFECVGTVKEARAAIELLCGNDVSARRLLRAFNNEHCVPEEFLPAVERMYQYVSAVD